MRQRERETSETERETSETQKERERPVRQRERERETSETERQRERPVRQRKRERPVRQTDRQTDKVGDSESEITKIQIYDFGLLQKIHVWPENIILYLAVRFFNARGRRSTKLPYSSLQTQGTFGLTMIQRCGMYFLRFEPRTTLTNNRKIKARSISATPIEIPRRKCLNVKKLCLQADMGQFNLPCE